MIRKALIGGAVVAGALALGQAAQAGIIYSNTGTFSGPDGDETIFETTFTLTQSEYVTVDTLGYAGGTQADGNVVPAGGFNSDLALFSGTGNGATLIASNDGATGGNPVTVPLSTFGACPASALAMDPGTGLVGDSCITLTLAAGTYTVALTEYDNDAIGPTLGAGFVESTLYDPGDPDFTGLFGNGSCSQFCDAGGNQRNDTFALDITVPEPATLPLFAAGLLAIGLMRRRWTA